MASKNTKNTKRTTSPKPRRHPELLKKSADMTVKGRIHGTGKRLTDAEKAQARKLRKADPETYTLRRLAAAFGLDTASMYYLLRNKPRVRKTAESKAKARKAKTTRTARKVKTVRLPVAAKRSR